MDNRPNPSRRITVDPTALIRRVRHHRRFRPILAAALIAVCLWALHEDHQRTQAVRADWGRAAEAWVTTSSFEAGHVLDTDDVRPQPLPPVALPADAVVATPVGRRLIDPAVAGEIVRAGRLGDGGGSANAAVIGPDRGAVTLPAAAPHVGPGDRVDLYTLLDGTVLAGNAEVIAVVDDLPVVAVSTADLGTVIQALSFGDVVPVLVG